MKAKNEKNNILLLCLICLWLVTIFIILAFQIRDLKIRVMELETENTQLLEDLDEVFDEVGDAFDEVDEEFEYHRDLIWELKERVKQLEELYDKEQRPSFEDYQYGIAKVVSRLNYGDYYAYVVEIQEALLTVYSQKLFSVGEDILIIEYNEGQIILVDLS